MVKAHRHHSSRYRVHNSVPVTEQANTGRLKWRAFLFMLLLFVFVEVAVIMYAAGIGTSGRMILQAQTSSVESRIKLTNDIRVLLGLDRLNATNETSSGEVYINGSVNSLTIEVFSEQYAEFCETYYLPRTGNVQKRFNHVFHQIVDPLDVSTTSSLGSRDTQKSPKDQICPCVPETLKGQTDVSLAVPHLGEIELENPSIQDGGLWKPDDCLARHRTAVIIPFRDREEHLKILLRYLHPMLQRQKLYYQIFVVEQAIPLVFNKASIMNVGYREASKTNSFDCFIFHDVDMIPENDYNFYTCTSQPRHVGSHCDKFGYKVPYPNLFGGVTAFTGHQFQQANGFSNEFYGWGGEDDDMFQRVKASNMNITRFPGEIARYTMIKHGSDVGNPYNSHSYIAWKPRPDHYKANGLNTLRYYRRQIVNRPLYTWILVELPDAPSRGRVSTKAKQTSASAASSRSRSEVWWLTLASLLCFIHPKFIVVS